MDVNCFLDGFGKIGRVAERVDRDVRGARGGSLDDATKLPDLSSLHEQIGEVDDGELAERPEAGDEAEDDVHVEGRGVAHRRPIFVQMKSCFHRISQ